MDDPATSEEVSANGDLKTSFPGRHPMVKQPILKNLEKLPDRGENRGGVGCGTFMVDDDQTKLQSKMK